MFEEKTPNVFDVGMDQTTQFISHLCDSIMNHEMHGIGFKCMPHVTKKLTIKKWTQSICHLEIFYYVRCHDKRLSKIDNVDFFKIKQK